jgi:hypothetical protein
VTTGGSDVGGSIGIPVRAASTNCSTGTVCGGAACPADELEPDDACGAAMSGNVGDRGGFGMAV